MRAEGGVCGVADASQSVPKRPRVWRDTARTIPDGKAFSRTWRSRTWRSKRPTRAAGSWRTRKKDVNAAERAIRDVKAAVAALSPTDRASAACYVSNASAITQKFRLVSQGVQVSADRETGQVTSTPSCPRSAVQVLSGDSLIAVSTRAPHLANSVAADASSTGS